MSTKIEKLLEARLIVSCIKKKGGFQELVDKEVAQKRIRTHYVEHCKGSVLKDSANVLLLSYIAIKSQPGSKQTVLLTMFHILKRKEEETVILFCVIITSALCLALLSIN